MALSVWHSRSPRARIRASAITISTPAAKSSGCPEPIGRHAPLDKTLRASARAPDAKRSWQRRRCADARLRPPERFARCRCPTSDRSGTSSDRSSPRLVSNASDTITTVCEVGQPDAGIDHRNLASPAAGPESARRQQSQRAVAVETDSRSSPPFGSLRSTRSRRRSAARPDSAVAKLQGGAAGVHPHRGPDLLDVPGRDLRRPPIEHHYVIGGRARSGVLGGQQHRRHTPSAGNRRRIRRCRQRRPPSRHAG